MSLPSPQKIKNKRKGYLFFELLKSCASGGGGGGGPSPHCPPEAPPLLVWSCVLFMDEKENKRVLVSELWQQLTFRVATKSKLFAGA